MFKLQVATENNIKYIKKELLNAGIKEKWIDFGENAKLWVIKKEIKGNYLIIAFFCLKKYESYILLEHFWIDPAFRNSGKTFKIISKMACDKAEMLGYKSMVINVGKKDIDVIEKTIGYGPFKTYDDEDNGSGAFFYMYPSSLKMFRKIKRNL